MHGRNYKGIANYDWKIFREKVTWESNAWAGR